MLFCFVLYKACPGKVKMSSINSTCHSVTFDWVLPFDENNIPYDVRLNYSYIDTREEQLPETNRTIVSGVSCKVVHLPSDTSVKFSFTAINKQGKEGPTTYYTIKTKKPCESMLCYAARAHYICARISMHV